MPTLLDAPLVDETLEALPGWNRGEGEIWRELRLPKALDAQLRKQVTQDAQAMEHEVQVETVKGGTRFVLRTPEVGGVSELDVMLASHISDVVHRLTEAAPGVPDEPGVEAVRADGVDVADLSSDQAVELSVQPEKVRQQVRF